jgi:hypothetical protein
VLRAAGETETTQDWLQLDEGDPGFQLLTEKEIAAVLIFLFIFISPSHTVKFSIHLFSKFFFVLRAIICFINPDDFSPEFIRISEGLLYVN